MISTRILKASLGKRVGGKIFYAEETCKKKKKPKKSKSVICWGMASNSNG